MKKTNIFRAFGMLAAGMLMTSLVWAQGDKPSPAATSTGQINGAKITITYSSPGVKGRKIWGGLVPYDKAWRAGANEATIFETDKAITVEGKSLPAGKYSLFAIPGEKQWTIILNSETGQWGIKQGGAANYDPAKNALSVTVKPMKSSTMHERLSYDITNKGFALIWENVEVPVSIK